MRCFKLQIQLMSTSVWFHAYSCISRRRASGKYIFGGNLLCLNFVPLDSDFLHLENPIFLSTNVYFECGQSIFVMRTAVFPKSNNVLQFLFNLREPILSSQKPIFLMRTPIFRYLYFILGAHIKNVQ